jgi:hypothetical protein
MLRLLIGILLGVISGGVVDYFFFSSIGGAMYPPPPNFDITNVQLATDYFGKMPNLVRLVNLLGIVFGSFVTGLIAAKIAFLSEDPKIAPRAARIAGFGMIVFQAMFMAFQAAQPWWFHLIGLVVIVPMAILGGRLVKN